MKQFLNDLRLLIGTIVLAVIAAHAYFGEWAAMETSIGLAKLGHAAVMCLLGASAIAATATALCVLLVWALEYPTMHRARLRRARLQSGRNIRIVAIGAATR